MTISLKPWARKPGKLIQNLHFWALILIIIALTLMYYQRILFHYIPEWFWQIEVFEFKNYLHGILLCIPLVYAALVFWWRGVFITWLLSVAITTPLILYYSPRAVTFATNLFYLLIPLLVVVYITLELNWRNKERKTLAEREAERQAYMSQIFTAQEEERRRIAQELHDDSTQTLLVIANRAQALVRHGISKSYPQVKEQAEWIRDAILQVSEDLRRLSRDLRPSILDEMGLLPALRLLVERLNQDGQTNTQIVIKGETCELQDAIEVTIFRIVQEALNNMRRHAQAAEATVTLEFHTETIKVSVQDNGKGFALPKRMSTLTAEGKLGLAGMQQRAKSLDGTFDIQSEPGKGTLISVEFRG